MARNEIEGLVILLDVGSSMSTKVNNSTTSYLQSCVDIIQMIVQRKMFQTSKDELGLILVGTRDTANPLWDGSSDHYSHVTVARQLSPVDWKLLDFIQNNISVSNVQGDILDGLLVASDHFHEDTNKCKAFKEKRIFILTDFGSGTEEDDKLDVICKGLFKHNIRVDVISPFSEFLVDERDQSNSPHPGGSNDDRAANNFVKQMTPEQRETQLLLRKICEATEGALYSFEETLGLLSSYQSKSVKSSGTKYLMKIGENFKMPIVSMIKCKENRPDLFKFKKVYGKNEAIELKTDRARFTKDEEQRDLSDKSEVVDAYRYGSTYVPIDDADSLRLKCEKCFDVLGFTKSENVLRHYYLSDACQQIMPDAAAGQEAEEAFVNMVHSMYLEDVVGLVRRVFSVRSSPELACLIPYISNDVVCLFYFALPFEDDVRKFTLENFTANKKFKPNENQLNLVDQLIDCMDLNPANKHTDKDNEDDEEDEDEMYDPHTTFNPYIQRMFQSIALRATNPNEKLPDFDTHLTSTLLNRIGAKIRNDKTLGLLKRCGEEFPVKPMVKKVKKDESNIFESKKEPLPGDEKEDEVLASQIDSNLGLDEILTDNKNSSKIKRVGTSNPVNDFQFLCDKLFSNQQISQETRQTDFEDLCVQIQILIREIFNESLVQISNASLEDATENDAAMLVFQEKAAACMRVQREYCLRFNCSNFFNSYLRTFKSYLLNEANNKKYANQIENFWNKHFSGQQNSMSLISSKENEQSDVSEEESELFVGHLREPKVDGNTDELNTNADDKEAEEVEDLLDLM